MVVNTQHEPESATVSFAPMTNRDKGSQPPPIRPFQPYKLVTLVSMPDTEKTLSVLVSCAEKTLSVFVSCAMCAEQIRKRTKCKG